MIKDWYVLKHFIYDLDGLEHFKTIFNVFLMRGTCFELFKTFEMGFKQVTTVLNNLECFECILTGWLMFQMISNISNKF